MPLAGLSLRDLEYLVAVGEHRHFGRAAAACAVSQPALSGQIRKTEELLRVTLFEPEIRERFTTFGFEPYASTPGEIMKAREDDLRRYGDIVARTEISIQ